MLKRVRAAHRTGKPALTNPMALAQVWHHGKREAVPARALHEIELAGKSLAPEMKYRGGALHLFGREAAIGAVSGLRPGARFMTQMAHDLDEHLTMGWHERAGSTA